MLTKLIGHFIWHKNLPNLPAILIRLWQHSSGDLNKLELLHFLPLPFGTRVHGILINDLPHLQR